MLFALGLAFVLQSAEPAPEIQAFTPQGFRTRIVVEIEAPREAVFEAATGDVSPWWDHTFWPGAGRAGDRT